MWNFFSRILIFLSLLSVGQIFGWEFMLAGIIFLSAMDKDYFETVLLGLIFDLTLAFPSFFFTSTILAILISSVLGQEIFKSENIFNRAVKALFLGLIALAVTFIFFWSNLTGGLGLAFWFSAVSLIKTLMSVLIVLFLAKFILPNYGQKISF